MYPKSLHVHICQKKRYGNLSADHCCRCLVTADYCFLVCTVEKAKC